MMSSWVTWVFIRAHWVSSSYLTGRGRKIVSWRERRFHAYETFSRDKRNPDARGNRSVPFDNNLHITAADPVLGEEPGDHDDQEDEVDARVLAPLYSSADRRLRLWEDVVLDSFA